MAKPKKYDDTALAKRIADEISRSLGGPDSDEASFRLRNLQFYKGQPVGELAPPVTPDRSQIVATDVADTVEWMLPSLVRVFSQSKDAMTCTARRPQYAPAAKMAAEYLRHHFWKRNSGFMLLYEWFKVALIQRVGYTKCYWDDSTTDAEESYTGLLPSQVEKLAAEDGVQILEATARMIRVEMEQSAGPVPPMEPQGTRAGPAPAPDAMPEEQTVEVEVYDITVQRTNKTGRCVIETVAPEYMRIHRMATYGKSVPFIAEVRPRFRFELEEEGYDLSDVGSGLPWSSAEESARRNSSASGNLHSAADGEAEFEQFEFVNAFIKLDQDQDGTAEWRHVVMVGDKVMSDDKVDDHPYVEVCPAPDPHTWEGQCPADFAIEPQRLNTSLLRGLMDNVYLTVNQRTAVVDGRVNLDDLTNSRPGGVVRVKDLQSMAPIQQTGLDQGAWQMVEWGEQWRERRTGFTRYSQGMSPDALNPTATGVGIITEKADQRTELIARVFAVSLERLITKMLKCMGRYQNVPELVELAGEWTEVDPREWADGFEIEVDVGLGTGSKDKKAMGLQQVFGMQQPLVQAGMMPPTAVVASGRAFAEAIGLGDPESYFPDPPPPQPPQPPPQVQIKQMELQADAQKFQATTQAEERRMQLEMQANQAAKTAELQVQAANDARDAERERERSLMESQLRAQEQENARYIADQKAAIDRYRIDVDAQVRREQYTVKAQQPAREPV